MNRYPFEMVFCWCCFWTAFEVETLLPCHCGRRIQSRMHGNILASFSVWMVAVVLANACLFCVQIWLTCLLYLYTKKKKQKTNKYFNDARLQTSCDFIIFHSGSTCVCVGSISIVQSLICPILSHFFSTCPCRFETFAWDGPQIVANLYKTCIESCVFLSVRKRHLIIFNDTSPNYSRSGFNLFDALFSLLSQCLNTVTQHRQSKHASWGPPLAELRLLGFHTITHTHTSSVK